ncbi:MULTISPECIES: STM4504/CBY_0614 family protein [Vibrio harveyi group]|uniref:STM4504/CBY_0614 family protein n=1 Tax=Vibrio harveyi group TaxID=717610 RepID=UPI00223F6308|nr:hypothetical protein [Vibrio parahaemolyticus]MDL2005454.1 hypothetical protein [Vibrio parahaemolyticus]
MPILELYSTRNKEVYPDIYRYEKPSNKLRVQLTKIINEAFGSIGIYKKDKTRYGSPAHFRFKEAFDLLSKEYGAEKLHGYSNGNHDWVRTALMHETKTERLLDLLEVLCTLLITKVEKNYRRYVDESGSKQKPFDAIAEINERMKRDGFGFEYINGIFIKIDQDFIHSEVTKPALFFLTDFDGARAEFLNAHEHYRHGRYEECLTDCNKSLESLLKQICEEQSWAYRKGTVNALIPVCMANDLFPSYLQTQFSSLSTLITQGVSTIRNNEGGHGQGSEIREIPLPLVSYVLHLTASNILFLGESYNKNILQQ